MNSKSVIKLFVVIALVFILSWVIYQAYLIRSDSDHVILQEDIKTQTDVIEERFEKTPKEQESEELENPQIQEEESEDDSTQKLSSLSEEEKEWIEFKEEIDETVETFRELGEQCQADIAELLEDPSFVDPRSELYSTHEYPVRMVESIIAASLHAYDPTMLYDSLEEAVEEGMAFETKQVNQYLMELQACLSPRIESFLMTFFDSTQIHDYDDEFLETIAPHLTTYLLQAPILIPPTMISLSFQLNVLQGMARNGLISSQYTSSLERLQIQLMDGHRAFSEVVYGESERVSEEDRREEMYSDFRNREIIQEELQAIMDEIMRGN